MYLGFFENFINTLKEYIYSTATIFLILFLIVSSAIVVIGHPVGGVVQKTVVSDLTNAILIEYNTHFEPEAVLTLHPDKDFNGVFDETERIEFLERAYQLLFPNISCTQGTQKLKFLEMDRRLSLEDAEDHRQ